MTIASISLPVMAGLVPAIHEGTPLSPGVRRCPDQVRA